MASAMSADPCEVAERVPGLLLVSAPPVILIGALNARLPEATGEIWEAQGELHVRNALADEEDSSMGGPETRT